MGTSSSGRDRDDMLTLDLMDVLKALKDATSRDFSGSTFRQTSGLFSKYGIENYF